MFKAMLVRSVLVVALVAAAESARADVVPSRAALNSLLGAGAVTEDFESYPVTSGNAANLGPVLNSTTVVNTLGPGPVVGGVNFSIAGTGSNNNLQWNGQAYYGQPSKDILSDTETLAVQFTNPVNAFGMDLLEFLGSPDEATATIYGTDDSTILDTISPIALPSDASPVFFGYSSPVDIGMVTISGSANSWSPIIDNLTFGDPVPEPATLTLLGSALLGVGVVYLRRSKVSGTLRVPPD